MFDYNPEEVLPIMMQIARNAGAIIMKHFESESLDIQTKTTAADLVTKADIESDQYIRGEIKKYFPKAGIITEEGSDIQPETSGPSGVFLCADPLDGTTNFSCFVPHFSVTIALLDTNYQPLAGCVYDPNRDEMFSAVKGKGAFLNSQKKLSVRQSKTLLESLVVTGFSPSHLYSDDNNLREITQILPKIRDLRRMGSAALDMCWVASSRFDAYFEKGPHIWDIAAGWIIIEEAGGVVTDYKGRKYCRESVEQLKALNIIATNRTLLPFLIENIGIARKGMD